MIEVLAECHATFQILPDADFHALASAYLHQHGVTVMEVGERVAKEQDSHSVGVSSHGEGEFLRM